MGKLYNTLSEKDKRRYAAVESIAIGYGGDTYISGILGCSPKTLSRGRKEIENMPHNAGYDTQIRKPGGGRKRYEEKYPDINEKFIAVLKKYTAGDPMKEKIIWTHLTPGEISVRIFEEYGDFVSVTVIKRLLKDHGYRLRKAQKFLPMKEVENRNEQFENIARLIAEYTALGLPIVSMDTKKKEHVGNYYRDGKLYTIEVVLTWDHDFLSFSTGIIVPHGIYDLLKNWAYINIGNSKDTSEFACDCLRNWWNQRGQYDYPGTPSILVLCDGGGSNMSNSYLFKEDLQKLVDEIGVEIRIAHYPPYCSKYNPIEHRLWPHVTRACQGVIFMDFDMVVGLIEKTHTKTGLTVEVNVIDKEYETGRKYAEDYKENMSIIRDPFLPKLNYRAVPQSS